MAKPLIYGDNTYDADAVESAEMQGFDHSYVPGYSETRRANELAVRDGKEVVVQDRLNWIRVSKTDGKDVDLRDFGEWYRLGYKFAELSDLEQRGWEMPPAAYAAPDGTIRREDSALVIVDSERARRNKERQEDFNAQFHGRAKPKRTAPKDPPPEGGVAEVAGGFSGQGSLEDAFKHLPDN